MKGLIQYIKDSWNELFGKSYLAHVGRSTKTDLDRGHRYADPGRCYRCGGLPVQQRNPGNIQNSQLTGKNNGQNGRNYQEVVRGAGYQRSGA